MEYVGTSAIAVAVAIANQGSIAGFLELLGYNVEDPGEVRAREDMRLVMSVVMGFGVLFALLSHIERVSYHHRVIEPTAFRHKFYFINWLINV